MMSYTTRFFDRFNHYLFALFLAVALMGLGSLAHGEATFQELRGFVIGPASPEGNLLDAGNGYVYGTTFQGGTNSVGTIYRIKKADGSFEIIHSFDSNCRFGCFPRAGVILSPDGFLYGSTASGGLNGVGTLFRIRLDGDSYRTIYDFKISDGVGPQADLILVPDGYLYGTTAAGGTSGLGTVFRVKINGSSFTTIHHFTGANGSVPQSQLVLATDGYLYGTTLSGGANDFGTVFRVKPNGTSFNTIHSFTGANGAFPKARVTVSGDYVYGSTSSGGGPSQSGTLFRMKLDGSSFNSIYVFNGSDGRSPSSPLILAPDGFFYGSTLSGGTGDRGTIFRINSDATIVEIVYAFSDCSEICAPQNVTLVDGYLYGTAGGAGASDPGAVFRVMPNGSSFSVVHEFSFCEGGCYPQAGTILAADGFLYGTTISGGPSGFGTIFKIKPDGTSFEILHGFIGNDGASPVGGLTVAPDGFLYGTTGAGGSTSTGTIFKIKTDGTSFSNIYSFFCGNGCGPQSALTLGPDGLLYGTTFAGGFTSNGTVFRASPDGTSINTVYSFNGFDGANPQTEVVFGSDGYLYGTTANGGSSGLGTVYRVKPDGTGFSVVHHFTGNDGANPQGSVNLHNDGFLYGTTFNGGVTFNGSVYRVKPDGSSFSTIHSFNGDDGANPQGNLFIGSDGLLYGSTYSGGRDFGGTVFKVNTEGTYFNVIYNFIERGFAPLGSFAISDGFLYGTTSNGGTGWAGTVYRLKLNPEP
jgi:uncharacterized repeat protein (TIGR03803 family)